MQFRSLDKKELDLVLMGQLIVFEYKQTNEDTNENTKKKFNYHFNNDIKLYSTLVSTFISNYANIHGYSSPDRNLQYDTQSIIYLPTDKDYTKAEIRSANYNEEKELIQKSTILSDTEHVYYDWAQNVPVPYSSQQIGTTYFKSALQAYIFDICNTGQNPAQQLNYVIAENEFLRGTITCDNCSAQNKNNLSLYFWCWLTANKGIRYNNSEGWAYYEFPKFLKPHFKELPGILKYNHFLFTSKNPEKVLYQTEAHGTYSTFNILKNKFNVNEVLDKISLKPLSKEHQEYLYYEIRKYVDIKFQDITCPKPSRLNK
ncbi:chaperonin: PROVISIONAL [Gigaspora margarita]|uniref:Chaperonin: PROVISIONAL n=1 Tax=Gigaspora margarita TaxID=4874 RepID=A0A8H4A8R4_GIGMA|nr:chaperonin: PROVISIONAL [Gigaspora margarita]